MATIVNKLPLTGAFLIFMILSCGVISSEQRRLVKTTDGNSSLKYQLLRRYLLKAATESVPVPAPTVSYDSTTSTTLHSSDGNVERGDDYRPTEPARPQSWCWPWQWSFWRTRNSREKPVNLIHSTHIYACMVPIFKFILQLFCNDRFETWKYVPVN